MVARQKLLNFTKSSHAQESYLQKGRKVLFCLLPTHRTHSLPSAGHGDVIDSFVLLQADQSMIQLFVCLFVCLFACLIVFVCMIPSSAISVLSCDVICCHMLSCDVMMKKTAT